MSKGFGIAGIFLATMSFVIPVLGIFTTVLAMLFGGIAALAGDRVLATATALLGATNLFFFSPTFLFALSMAIDEQIMETMVFHFMVLVSPALPTIAIILNASGKFALAKTRAQ